jgi:hypothetical protein
MGFLAAAIPIATSVLGALSQDDKKQQPQQVMAPPPTLGQVFAQQWQQNNQPRTHTNPFGGTGGQF